ncbi:MAG TPA: addiction module protein, partial [Chitinophagaceae bacterium]|nr:addiction module protein [Chitinophagaceae bacterium]
SKTMTTILIKKKLAKAINEIDDTDFLKALQTIVNSKKEEENIYQLSSEQKRELDKRQARHQSGESKSYSWTAVKRSLPKK